MKKQLSLLVLVYLRFWAKLKLSQINPIVIGVTGSVGKSSTVAGRIEEEVNAELLVSQCKDRGLKTNTLLRIGSTEVKQGASPNEVMTAIVNALGKQGISLNRSLRSKLWKNLMQIKKSMRTGK